jgi:hypothetical protein
MARVTIPFTAIGTRPLPETCMRCGAKAAGYYPRELKQAYKDPASGQFIPFSIRFDAPLCQQHLQPWTRGAAVKCLLVLLSLVAVGGLLLGGAGKIEAAEAAIAAMLVLALVVLLTAPPVRFKVDSWIHPTAVTLIGVSREFAQKVDAAAEDSQGQEPSMHPTAGTIMPGGTVKRVTGNTVAWLGSALMVVGGLLVAGTVKASMDRPAQRPSAVFETREEQITRLTEEIKEL